MLLVASDPVFAEHDTGRGHPERPVRLEAVMAGVARAGLDDALRPLAVRPATAEELERARSRAHLDEVRALCERGGGAIDADTVVSGRSWEAAVTAAGSGLAAAEALERGDGDAASRALRPGGGQRVAGVDFDAHHGNGTQDVFYRDPRVLYVSLHQWPLYPGTGRLDDTGRDAGAGTTCNLPLPAGTTGDVYLAALDDVIIPVVERFEPHWLLLSAGFDGHRADPLTGLSLAADDFGLIPARRAALVPAGRRIAFLEGGYDLDALTRSVATTLPSLVGAVAPREEPPSSGGPGHVVVDAARQLWAELTV